MPANKQNLWQWSEAAGGSIQGREISRFTDLAHACTLSQYNKCIEATETVKAHKGVAAVWMNECEYAKCKRANIQRGDKIKLSNTEVKVSWVHRQTSIKAEALSVAHSKCALEYESSNSIKSMVLWNLHVSKKQILEEFVDKNGYIVFFPPF